MIEYHLGKVNVLANLLSRKSLVTLAVVRASTYLGYFISESWVCGLRQRLVESC